MQYRFDGVLRNTVGYALSGVDVYVCTQPASTGSIPPSPLATLYTSSSGATILPQPIQTDGNGNFFFYAPTNVYTLVYYDPENRIPTQVYPDQQVVTQGGGSVTSVGLTMDGVIFNTSVSGSPVTGAGTLVPTLIVENANTVLAGPGSGTAALPTWRTLVTADLPAGVGSVTSVALTLAGSGLLTFSVTGSPVTSSGTLGLSINFANQNPNTFLAGPISGASGAVSARAIAPPDISGVAAVSSSATPNFDCSTGAALVTFLYTLAQNAAPTVVNGIPGQMITFKITSPGVWTWTWPATFFGASNVETVNTGVSVQTFVCISSTEFRAIGPGSFNET